MGLLVVTGVVELWHIYVLALMLGTINAMTGRCGRRSWWSWWAANRW